MHSVIGVLVTGDTNEEIFENAESAYDQLLDRVSYFDYYKLFDETESKMAGRERYGDWMIDEFGELVVLARACEGVGREVVEFLWNKTTEKYDQRFETVIEHIDELDAETLREQDSQPAFKVRHAMEMLSQQEGPGIYLYDSTGSGFRSRDRLEEWIYSDTEYWIVPADIHY